MRFVLWCGFAVSLLFGLFCVALVVDGCAHSSGNYGGLNELSATVGGVLLLPTAWALYALFRRLFPRE